MQLRSRSGIGSQLGFALFTIRVGWNIGSKEELYLWERFLGGNRNLGYSGNERGDVGGD